MCNAARVVVLVLYGCTIRVVIQNKNCELLYNHFLPDVIDRNIFNVVTPRVHCVYMLRRNKGILYWIVSYRIASRRIVSYRIVSYRIVSYCIVLYCIVLYCIVLRCVLTLTQMLFYLSLYVMCVLSLFGECPIPCNIIML